MFNILIMMKLKLHFKECCCRYYHFSVTGNSDLAISWCVSKWVCSLYPWSQAAVRWRPDCSLLVCSKFSDRGWLDECIVSVWPSTPYQKSTLELVFDDPQNWARTLFVGPVNLFYLGSKCKQYNNTAWCKIWQANNKRHNKYFYNTT